MTSSPTRRFAARFAYLFPLLLAVLFTVTSMIPHLFFIYGAEAQETLSLFSLMGNAVRISRQLLTGTIEGSAADEACSRAVIAWFVIALLGLVLFWITALLEAIFGSYVHSLPPASDAANRAKRWFRFLCPNRVLLQLAHLGLLLPLFFPQILQYLSRQYLGIDAVPHYLGWHDLWIYGGLLLLGAVLLFGTIPWQSLEHMDLYQLYRRKNDREREVR